jgi:hypothetical protein
MVKKAWFVVLMIFLCLSAYSQTREDVSIYVPPVVGGTSEAQSFFTENLKMEVMARAFALADREKGADYQLAGSLSKEEAFVDEYDEYEAYVPAEILHLSLIDNKDGHIIAEQDLFYYTMEETYEYLPFLAFSMFGNVPLTKVSLNDNWRHKWMYLTAQVMWTPRMYIGTASSADFVQFGAGLAFELHFLNFMSVEVGAEYSNDYVRAIDSKPPLEFKTGMFEVPVLVKFVFKPGNHFMIEPYGGIQLNASTSTEINPPPLAWLVGVNYGVQVGGGAVFLDLKFVADLGDSRVNDPNVDPYNRYVIKVGIGYKYGFIVRKR